MSVTHTHKKPRAIYVVTSPISTFFACVHAQSYHAHDECYLIIDPGKRKSSLINRITEVSKQFTWKSLHDFSVIIPENEDLKPGVRKKLTRKLKNAPVIGSIYHFLLKKYNSKASASHEKLLEQIPIEINDPVQLYVLEFTAINAALQSRFNNGELSYYEHGIGDYMAWANGEKKFPFYCFFAESMKQFIREKHPGKEIHIKPISTQPFELPKAQIELPLTGQRNMALWILQPLDVYHVTDACWRSYAEKVAQVCKQKHINRVLIKTHPLQSLRPMDIIRKEAEKHNLEIVYVNDPVFNAGAVEFIYAALKTDVKLVISLFSSSVFYLSKFDQSAEVDFYYSYDFLSAFISNAPADYKKRYAEQRPYFTQIFSENCTSF